MITTSRNTVVALFDSESKARAVVEDLVRTGFSREEVHLGSRGTYSSDAALGGSGLSGRAPAEHHGGGFMGWLSSLFGDDDYANEDAEHYDRAVQSGKCVVAVDVDNDRRTEEAIDIMNSHGAVDVDTQAADRRYDAVDQTVTRDRDRARVSEGASEGSIPVVEEQLEIGKRAVQRGGVRVYSRVVEQPVEQEVELREEKVRVDRRPVNRPVTDADANALRDQTIEVTEMREEPVVNKRSRVVEEVRVGKETTSRTEKVSDKVKRTEVRTEPIAAGSERGYSDDFRTDFNTRYGASGGRYETYQPAYDYGYRMAQDPRYSGRSWSDVESTLQTDYMRNNPNSTWDEMKGAVRYGWEKVSGKR